MTNTNGESCVCCARCGRVLREREAYKLGYFWLCAYCMSDINSHEEESA